MDDYTRIIIGLSNGSIRFYDIEHYRYDSDLCSDANNFNDELTSMYYFNNKCILLTSHSSGLNKLLICPPHPMKFISILEFYNKDIKDEKNNIPVTCFDFDESTNMLFCGDQLGYISCYSLKEFFKTIETSGLNDSSKIFNNFNQMVFSINFYQL
jgi:hypothetical protein